MEINTNMNVSGVNGLTPSRRSPAAAQTAQDTASFDGTAGVESTLENLPTSRPESVALAKQLINDPNYPSPSVVKQLSQFLASKINSTNEQQ
jgi:hypothetical protein